VNANVSTFVGLDVHKKTIQVALLSPGADKPEEWQVANEPAAVKRLVRKLKREPSVRCCYEAGPMGYGLRRQLAGEGIECAVIAPSLTPVKPGERIKTDRRDAAKLAQLFRGDLLTVVHAPTEDDESARDLSRCREDVMEDLRRSRHRLGKFLLRRAVRYTLTKHAWGSTHRDWLRGLQFDRPTDQTVFDTYLLSLEQLEERLRGLDAKLAELADREPYRRPVAWLRCLCGVDTVTAMALVTELHGFERFHSPRALMGYLGLVPSEHSSGEGKHRGAITKTGNRHVRRLLVEAAQHYRTRAVAGFRLKKRREGQPAPVVALAQRAHQRLSRRYWQLSLRGKPTNKVVIAIARELTGFIWALLHPSQLDALNR